MSVIGIILLIILLMFVVGGIPTMPWYGQPHSYGYWPSGGLGLVLVIVLILALIGRV